MTQRKPAKRVTISDVAQHAGVSSMTVSRVMNRDGKVKALTREKVETAISELNYAPNLAARSLAGSKIRRICLLYGNPSSAYLGELLLGALEATSDAGVHLIVERTSPDLAPASLREKFERDWDALIVPPPMSDISGIRKIINRQNFPAAFISSATEPGHANEVRINDRLAAYEMTIFLISKGHHDIGFIKGHPNQTVSEQRYLGYCDALADKGVIPNQQWIMEGLFTYRSGEEAGLKLLGSKHRPTAIFASNDDMAAGVLAAAARKGMSVPEHLSVVGFDNSPIASTVWPGLTTLSQPVAELAAKAVDLILNTRTLDQTNTDNFSTIIMPHKLVERGSVMPV